MRKAGGIDKDTRKGYPYRAAVRAPLRVPTAEKVAALQIDGSEALLGMLNRVGGKRSLQEHMSIS
jgi:hypothetical protein